MDFEKPGNRLKPTPKPPQRKGQSIFPDDRCRELMEQLGMPNSRSLYTALNQVANEVEQGARENIGTQLELLASVSCNHSKRIDALEANGNGN